MAWSTLVESAALTVDADYEAFLSSSDPIIISLNPRELLSLTFNIDSVGTTDDIEILVLGGHKVGADGDLDGFTSTTDLELETAVHPISADDEFNGYYLAMITSGNARGDVRLITDSVAADDGVVLDHAQKGNAAAADPYQLYRLRKMTEFVIDGTTAIDEDNPMNGGITVIGVPYVIVMCRAAGATDAHLVYMSYQKDGVSA